jgi:hypothetical protein
MASSATRRIDRLNALSAGRGSDAYVDVAWDDPEMAIGSDDDRLRLAPFDPLASTEWYRNLPAERKVLVGAWRTATMFRTGAHFENVLQQALLHRALYHPGRGPEYRYLHHEVIEESQHTLMFNEVVERIGLPALGMPRWLRRFSEMTVPVLARHDPAAFFMVVLSGEDPVDHYQRRFLAAGVSHPLVEKVIRIHVAEEARHVSFARISLETSVAGLSRGRRWLLSVTTPVNLALSARIMLVPPREMARGLGVSHRSLTSAYRGQEGRRFLAECVDRPRRLAEDLGLSSRTGRLLWRALLLPRIRTTSQGEARLLDRTAA